MYLRSTGPAFINFGDVCMRSTNTNHINIVNNLESFIYVQVGVSRAASLHVIVSVYHIMIYCIG